MALQDKMGKELFSGKVDVVANEYHGANGDSIMIRIGDGCTLWTSLKNAAHIGGLKGMDKPLRKKTGRTGRVERVVEKASEQKHSDVLAQIRQLEAQAKKLLRK